MTTRQRATRSTVINPANRRLSKSLLLSDFMACDSSIRYGYPNVITERDEDKIEEGRYLANQIENLICLFGPCGISYGYISPALSAKVVHYQNPELPSYHRWDAGAAADLFFPEMIEEGNNFASPIALAAGIEEANIDYSRLITYAESPWICFATRRSEGPRPRKALYENRFNGERKPEHVHYPQGKENRMNKLMEAQENPVPWQGRGWPSYHGKGRLQFQHQGVSRYSSMIKYLANPEYIHKGIPNRPPLTNRAAMGRWWLCAEQAGKIVDTMTEAFSTHISVTSAFVCDVPGRDWKDYATLEIAVPYEADPQDALAVVQNTGITKQAHIVDSPVPKIRIVCDEIDIRNLGSTGSTD